MKKDVVLLIMWATAVALSLWIIRDYQTIEGLIEELDQQQNKVYQLEQENRQLHDDVWVLNQELMKGCME